MSRSNFLLVRPTSTRSLNGLNNLILFGEKSLRHVIKEYMAHYHTERNHQGIENVIPSPDDRFKHSGDSIKKSERLGGLLNFYHRKAS